MGEKFAYLNSSPPRGEIPEVGNETHCPQCGHPLELGYGLAGGGIGAYKYCHHCMTVASKTEDAEAANADAPPSVHSEPPKGNTDV